MFLTHEFQNLVVEVVTGNTDGFVGDNATQGYDGYFRSTASDVDYHVAHRFEHVYAYTDSGSHRLVDKTNLLGSGLFGTVLDGAFLNFGDA